MIDGTRFDERLREQEGPFEERVGELDASSLLFVFPDFPSGVDPRLEENLDGVYGRLVRFPGVRRPGVYMRAAAGGKHWILRFDCAGYTQRVDKWSAEDFLIKADSMRYVRMRYLVQEGEDRRVDQVARSVQLRQRGESSDQRIRLLEMPEIPVMSALPMDGDLSEAIVNLADAMVADGRTHLDPFIINRLANEVKRRCRDVLRDTA